MDVELSRGGCAKKKASILVADVHISNLTWHAEEKHKSRLHYAVNFCRKNEEIWLYIQNAHKNHAASGGSRSDYISDRRSFWYGPSVDTRMGASNLPFKLLKQQFSGA